MKTKVSFVILSHNDGEMAANAIKSVKKLKTKGFKITYIDVNSKGIVNLNQLKKSLRNPVAPVIKTFKRLSLAACSLAWRISSNYCDSRC